MLRPLALALLGSALLGPAPSGAPGPGGGTRLSTSRATVVLADLHLGPGRRPGGAWDPREDFRWHADLGAFLDAVDAEGQGATDLVINGDLFDLWQVAPAACRVPDAARGCTEAEALASLEQVLAAHVPAIEALGRFAASGGNRVVLVPGDHDAALLFPAVAARARAALAAAGGRVEIAAGGAWQSGDGRLRAEHGHQFDQPAERLAGWPAPFRAHPDGRSLVRSGAEELVQAFVNRFEGAYPLLDNVAEQGRGLRYGLVAEGFPDGGAPLAAVSRYFLFKTTWEQFRTNLEGEQQPPSWDLEQVRAQGDAFLVESLPPDDPLHPVMEAALAAGTLPFEAAELQDEQIVAICDYRAAIRRSRRRLEQTLDQLGPIAGPPVRECPRDPATRGGRFGYFFRSRDAQIAAHLDRLAARQDVPVDVIDVLIGSHSHLPVRPFTPRGTAAGLTVVGTGAWQRVITPARLEQRAAARETPVTDLLRVLVPEDLEPCYPFVSVAPYADRPEPRLRGWRREASGTWAFAGCD